MKKFFSLLFCTTLFFAACDEELTTISGSSAETATAFSDLEECNKSIVGKLVYVSDSTRMYACTDEGWAAFKVAAENGKNGSNGADGKDGTNGKNGKDGTNGKDGINGKDGKNGSDGVSCTVKAIDDGYKVLCGGDSVGVLLNGTDGAAGKSCTTKQVKDGIEVSCPGAEPVVVKNGTSGAAGSSCTTKQVEDGIEVSCPGADPVVVKNGTSGAAGSSCTTKQVEDGIEVNCPGADPVVIKNGTDGTAGESAYELSGFEGSLAEWLESLKGENGKNGTGCNIESDMDGVITLKCGEGENTKTTKLYKALCGTTPYDPEKKLCYNFELYSCNDKPYNPENVFCGKLEDGTEKLYKLCNEQTYDVNNQFCETSASGTETIMMMCGTTAYNPQSALCKNSELYSCNNKPYDPDNQFCAKFPSSERAYKKVTITIEEKNYSETWMAENLNRSTASGSYCYNNNSSYCTEYGRLYTWATAMGKTEEECGDGKNCGMGDGVIQGICPEGWHLPSVAEFEALIVAVDGSITEYTVSNTAGKALKASFSWYDAELDEVNSSNGSDTYSFAALLAGYMDSEKTFHYEYFNTDFWSSRERGTSGASSMTLYCDNDYAQIRIGKGLKKTSAASVRCIKNK